MSEFLTGVYCQCGKLLYKVDEKTPYRIECECPNCKLTSYRKGYGNLKFEEIFVQKTSEASL